MVTDDVQIAMGSASELEYQLLLARDLGYLSQAQFDVLDRDVVEVERMLASLLVGLRHRTGNGANTTPARSRPPERTDGLSD